MKKLTLGSLFDGSGGFPLAGMLCGIEPIWASEIAPFPIRVTTKRLPQVKHYGDISKLNGAELPPVDIITLGSPCQSVSQAGKRAGIKHIDHESDITTRSGLFFEAIRIIKEMRCATNGKYPRYAVFENVPGIFSSSGGEDYQTVLEEFCSVKETDIHIPRPKKWERAGEILGKDYSFAWRCLDAQYFGTAQRRLRVFAVADFGGQCAPKILFEQESLRGDIAESLRTWQRAASNTKEGIGATGRNDNITIINDQGGNRIDITKDVTCTLRAEAHHPPVVLESAGFCTEHSAKSRSIGYEKEVSPTLRAGTVPAAVYENHSQATRYTGPLDVAPTVLSTYGTGGNNQPFVVESKAFGICSAESNAMKSDNPHSGFYETETSRTIDTSSQSPARNQGGIAIVENIKNYDVRITSEGTKNARQNVYETETARTVDTGGISPDSNQGGVAVVAVQGSMICRKDKNGPQGSGVNENISFTLNTCDKHAVAYGIDRSAYNQGQNAQYNFSVEEEIEPTMVAKGPGAVAQPTYSTSKNSYHTRVSVELADTLVASDYKDPPVVNDTDGVKYIVRRLTASECAMLQGFSPDWCKDLETENPTQEDIKEWREIFLEYNRAMGKSTKPKSDKQIIKWLQNPHSESAEYTLWGNGVCLPCICFVLSGIVYFHEQEDKV